MLMAAVWLAVFAIVPPAVLSAAAKESVLVDFAASRTDPDGTKIRPYEYAFGDWGGGHVIDLSGKGTLVKSATGKGGLGENRTMVKFDKTPLVDLSFVIGTANHATSLTFALTDKDGTEHQWSISLAGKSPGQEIRTRLDLTKRDSEQKPGTVPGLDLKKITTWQVRGDYSAPNVEVLLLKLTGPK